MADLKIKILGGDDATNENLITWLSANGTLSEIDSVIMSGTYTFKKTLSVFSSSTITFDGYFLDGLGDSYNKMNISSTNISYQLNDTTSKVVYNYDGGWVDTSSRVIYFANDTTVDNADFVEWFESNQIGEEETNVYSERVNGALSITLRRQIANPLDVSEVFIHLEDFEAYVHQDTSYNNPNISEDDNAFLLSINPYSYVGQVCSVIEDGVATAYVIDKVGEDGTYHTIGGGVDTSNLISRVDSLPTADEESPDFIMLNTNGDLYKRVLVSGSYNYIKTLSTNDITSSITSGSTSAITSGAVYTESNRLSGLINNKQDKLIAGSGISIVNGVISVNLPNYAGESENL